MKRMIIALLLLLTQTAMASRNDISIIARTILGEARGEGLIGMALVADVIYTRSIERGLPPVQVCKEDNQFAGRSYLPDWNTPEARTAINLAILVYKRVDVVKGVSHNHFWNGESPHWATNARKFTWKNHTFCRI